MWFKSPPVDAAPVAQAAAPVLSPVAAAVRVEVRPDGILYAVIGASRSGKTVWTAQRVRRERRLMVWDYPKGEWANRYSCRRVTDFRELLELTRPGSRPARVAFARATETPEKDFAVWCRLAWGYAQAHGAPIVAEELSTVTHPGKAPGAWGNVCRMALGSGSDIYALSQRAAESDKTALGNATVVHCGRLNIPDDRATMAKYLGVSVAAVSALQPMEYLERDAMGRVTRGRVTPK